MAAKDIKTKLRLHHADGTITDVDPPSWVLIVRDLEEKIKRMHEALSYYAEKKHDGLVARTALENRPTNLKYRR